MKEFSTAEKIIYYMTCFLGTFANLVGWSYVVGFSVWTLLFGTESLILTALWIGPFVPGAIKPKVLKTLMFLEAVIILARLTVMPFSVG